MAGIGRPQAEPQELIGKHNLGTFVSLTQIVSSAIISIKSIKNGSRCNDKGKPIERWGRRAMGLKPRGAMMARLPKATISMVPAFIKPVEAGFILGRPKRQGADCSKTEVLLLRVV